MAPEMALTMRSIITLGLLCVTMGETNTFRVARARCSYTTYTGQSDDARLVRWQKRPRPQTPLIFYIRGLKHACVVHIGNVEATRHAWDRRTASRSYQRPTKIYIDSRSTEAHAPSFVATAAPSHSSGPRTYPDGWVYVARFSAIHFRGYLIREVSCYTLLSGL